MCISTSLQAAFGRLRELKQEIENLQLLLEQSRTRLQRDFAQWVAVMTRYQQQHGGAGGALRQSSGSLRSSASSIAPAPPLAAAHNGAYQNGGAGRPLALSSTVGAGYRSSQGDAAWQPPAAGGPAQPMPAGTAPGNGFHTPTMQSPEKALGSAGGPAWSSVHGRPVQQSPASSGQWQGAGTSTGGALQARHSLQLSPGGGAAGAPPRSPAAAPQVPRQAWAETAAPAAGGAVLRASNGGYTMPGGYGPAGNGNLAQLRHSVNGGAGASSSAGGASLASSMQSEAGGLAGVDPAVLAAARPYLTGNAEADADIIKFYEARAKLLQKMAAPAQ